MLQYQPDPPPGLLGSIVHRLGERSSRLSLLPLAGHSGLIPPKSPPRPTFRHQPLDLSSHQRPLEHRMGSVGLPKLHLTLTPSLSPPGTRLPARLRHHAGVQPGHSSSVLIVSPPPLLATPLLPSGTTPPLPTALARLRRDSPTGCPTPTAHRSGLLPPRTSSITPMAPNRPSHSLFLTPYSHSDRTHTLDVSYTHSPPPLLHIYLCSYSLGV